MFDQPLANGVNIFKAVALLLLVVAAMAAGSFAKRSGRAMRFRQWLAQNRNFQTALLWLCIALVFFIFGGLTIAYELTQA